MNVGGEAGIDQFLRISVSSLTYFFTAFKELLNISVIHQQSTNIESQQPATEQENAQ